MTSRYPQRDKRVGLRLFGAGYTTGPEKLAIRDAGFRRIRFPATVAVIEHPDFGMTMFDTGYSPRFREVTARFPQRLYAIATPVTIDSAMTAKSRLAALGIDARTIRTVILSHFHADHIGAVADFPNARYIYLREAWTAVRSLRGFSAVRHGFLPDLLPDDFEARSDALDRSAFQNGFVEYGPFADSYDVFGDGTVAAVELPGHVDGQLGIFVRAHQGVVFFVADACWQSRAYRDRIMPHPITRLIHSDMTAYRRTLGRLHDLWTARPEIQIVPCHCSEALDHFGTESEEGPGD